MNSLFITYSALFLVAILSIGILSYFSFINKKIDLKNWFFIVLGFILLTNFLYLFNKGMEVNEKLSIENIPMEIVSTDDSRNDSIINDTVLYRYLNDIRSNHAEIILIQCKIESNNYKSGLFLGNNNLLGMKVSSMRISINNGSRAGYQKYSSWKQSLQDYVLWGYSHGFNKLSTDEYINLLQKIYAEDPNYGSKIRKMLKEIDFEKLK